MRKLIASAIVGLTVLSAWSAGQADLTTYFHCDFSDGLPDGATVEDVDGAPLYFLMTQAGFKQGDSWKVFYDRQNLNYYIASPSYHKTPAGQDPVPADDHFNLPPVLIRGAEAVMTWRVRSINEQSNTAASTYSVLVNGKELLANATTSLTEWTDCELSLADYAGQTVEITFVNNTLKGEILALDDIVIAGLSGVAAVEFVPGAYAVGTESFKVGIKVTATDPSQPVVSAAVNCMMADGVTTYSGEVSNLNLTFGQSCVVSVDHEFAGSYGDSFSYTLTPTVNGVQFDPGRFTTTMLPFMPHKRTVVEETTGQWCGWCPLGIVALDSLHTIFGSDVIPIAIHIGADDMAFDTYAEAAGIGGGAAPVGIFDRELYNQDPMTLIKVGLNESYTVWRGGFATDAETRLAMLAGGDIDVKASFGTDGKTVEVQTVTRSIRDLTDAGWRVGLTMVEDGVWMDGYYQTNYLANYPNRAPVGDFCERPSAIVSDFEYNHVARSVARNAFRGIEGSLPASLTAGEEYAFDYSWPIPSNVLNPRRLKIVAMIIDSDNHIVNASEVALDPTASVAEVECEDEHIAIGGGCVTVAGAGVVCVALVDMQGRVVNSASAEGSVTVSARPGIYLLRTPSRTLKIRL